LQDGEEHMESDPTVETNRSYVTNSHFGESPIYQQETLRPMEVNGVYNIAKLASLAFCFASPYVKLRIKSQLTSSNFTSEIIGTLLTVFIVISEAYLSSFFPSLNG